MDGPGAGVAQEPGDGGHAPAGLADVVDQQPRLALDGGEILIDAVSADGDELVD